MQSLRHILGLGLMLSMATACVHTDVQRIGRLRLQNPKEGFAPVLTQISTDYERVAVIRAKASAAGSKQRLTKYLRRQASVAGCDAIARIVFQSKTSAHALCLERREPEHKHSATNRLPAQASDKLLSELAQSGEEGILLAQMLAKSNGRRAEERRHLINWYLDTYPQTTFRAELMGLFPSIKGIKIAAQGYTSSTL
ncbi:MAG: hypothetical protein QGI45_05405 [Myxococcota bacterium]|nr:hypothetical protein [Myxococcota bacterium]